MGTMVQWSLTRLCKTIMGCVNNEFDVILMIEGNRGLGKSTLGYKISRRCKTYGLRFNPHIHIAYARDDVIRLLANNERTIIFADEMINVSYNRDFFESDQKKLIKGFNMYRDSCNVFIGCIPKFIDLDKQIQRLVKIRITVVKRGFALIQTQIGGIYREDPWDIKNNKKMEEKVFKTKRPYGKISTVVGYIVYGDLNEDQKEIYRAIKKDKRGRVYMEQDGYDPKDPKTIFVENLLDKMIKRKITLSEFKVACDLSGYKERTIRGNINDMLREKGREERSQFFFKAAEEKRLNDIKKQKKKEADKKKITIVHKKEISFDSEAEENTTPPDEGKDPLPLNDNNFNYNTRDDISWESL